MVQTGPWWRVRTPVHPGPRTQGPSLCPRRLLGATRWEPGQAGTTCCGEGRGGLPGVLGARGGWGPVAPRSMGRGQPGQILTGAPGRGGMHRRSRGPPPGPAPWPSWGSWHLDDLSSPVWLAASESLPSGPVSHLPPPIPAPAGRTPREGRGGPTRRALVSEEGAALASAWAPGGLVAVASPLLGWARHPPSTHPCFSFTGMGRPGSVSREWGGLAQFYRDGEAWLPRPNSCRLCFSPPAAFPSPCTSTTTALLRYNLHTMKCAPGG